MSDEKIYFGVKDKLPKGYTRFAGINDITNETQVKRWGRYRIDSRKINYILNEKEKEKTGVQKRNEFYSDRGKVIALLRKLRNSDLETKEKNKLKSKLEDFYKKRY